MGKNVEDITGVFDGEQFLVLKVLLGEKWAKKFKEVWDRMPLYPYTYGWHRRPFRSTGKGEAYLHQGLGKLYEMIELMISKFSYDHYFSGSNSQPFINNQLIADLIALEIDEGNEKIIKNLDDIAHAETNTGILTGQMIKGMLKSHNPKMHKWVSGLMQSAQLQEGLRQTIAKTMDEGSKEGFLFMLKLLLDQEMIRFSSVVRALNVWMSLYIPPENLVIVRKCLEAGYKALTDEGYLEEILKSEDTQMIYMGLWAAAFKDINQAEEKVKEFLVSKVKYKKLIALYFISQIQLPYKQHRLAMPLLDDEDFEVKYWAIYNLFSMRHSGCYGSEGLFNRLKDLLNHLPKKGMLFKESIFPWQEARLDQEFVIEKMMKVLQDERLQNKELADKHLEEMLDYIDKMSINIRENFISSFLQKPSTEKQKVTLIKLLGDKSKMVRMQAEKVAHGLELSDKDYQILEGFLKYKTEDLRKSVIDLLMKQDPENLLETLKRLAEDKDENKHLALADMAAAAQKEERFKEIAAACKKIALSVADTSKRTKKLSENIKSKEQEAYTPENGFGLCDPKKEIKFGEIKCDEDFCCEDILCSSVEDMGKILASFGKLVDKYKDFEYEVESDDYGTFKTVLGSHTWITPIRSPKKGEATIEDYPLADVWKEEGKRLSLTAENIFELLFYYRCLYRAKSYDEPILSFFKVDIQDFNEMLGSVKCMEHVYDILNVLFKEFEKEKRFWIALNMSRVLYSRKPLDELYIKKELIYSDGSIIPQRHLFSAISPVVFCHQVMRESISDDKDFARFIKMEYAYYQAVEYKKPVSLSLEDFERAFELGLIDENELYLEMCMRDSSRENLRKITSRENWEESLNLRKLKEVALKAAERIVMIEAKRGDRATPVSHLAASIQRCEGVNCFVSLILGLEKESFIREDRYITENSTKKEILSHLLKCCYPKDGEDENTLKEVLKDIKVSKKQLIDAAMYMPWWLRSLEKYLELEGLTMAGWYFHAHINESFSEEKEAMVARFSPIEAEEFENGAFDVDWFREAYKMLGEDNFKLVYDSAKYIAAGALHKRSQLFADAALGRLSRKEAEEIITSRRNKDYVLCYGLIPLSNGKEEILHRYEFLHRFRKESSQFGAQRRASEQLSADIALYNLARNAGFSDVNRFTWYMETEKMKTIRSYLEPKNLQDVTVSLLIDEGGEAKIQVIKDGKALKSIPANLKKEDYIKTLQKTKNSLKEQYIRAKASLERAMEMEEAFTKEELTNLSINPVIEPLLRNLVFISSDKDENKNEDKNGYFRCGTLVGCFNNEFALKEDEKLIIAHPVHLYKKGIWSAYQKDIFDRSIMQPFKQVFRELYRPNGDELKDGKISYRYYGHQIQPMKAMALLKTRGWVLDDYDGFQKVYYKQNIAALLSVRADWFSPADIEPPTIQYVLFIDRKTGSILSFEDIPECIFSEVMRDIDLVVSVAHVGGVDIEASLSTIEMRKAVISEMLRLLKLTNVTLKDAHAFIKGKYGEYTVHLGSGIVHKMLAGAIHILAIHSGHRGKIFLPFMDEDPRTAEIISKIVLLAEDKKIKDPTILEQVTR